MSPKQPSANDSLLMIRFEKGIPQDVLCFPDFPVERIATASYYSKHNDKIKNIS